MALLPLIAILFFSSCSGSEPKTETVDKDKVKTEIQALEDGFAAAEKARNVDGVAVYYSENATSFGRNEAPSVGMTAIKDKITRGFATDSIGDYNVYKVKDLYVEGNTAAEIGTWTKHKADGKEVDNGHYMAYFEKKDGKYQCVRDMAVSSTPKK